MGADWAFVVEMEHAGDETYINTCQFLGRKSLPGLSDDSEIQYASSSGLKFLLNAGYFVAGRSTHAYQTMNATNGLYYGYGAGVAGGLCYTGGIPAAHGFLFTPNVGTGSYPHVDSYQSAAATATNNSETTPAFLRLRGVKLDLKSTTNLVKRLWVRQGGFLPTIADVGMPAIINISPKVAGVSGQEVSAALHLPTGVARAVLIHFHPNASSEYHHGFESTDHALYSSLLADGVAIAVIRGTSDAAGGTTYTNREASDWGSPTPGGTFRDSLIAYLATLFPGLPLFGAGTSMGGATMLGRELRVPGTFTAIALMSAVTNLDHCYEDTGQDFDELIDAAYEDVGAWDSIKASYDPNLNLRALACVPVMAFADVDESVVSTPDNSQSFAQEIAARGGDASFTDCPGAGHMGAAVYDTDIKAFFDRFVDGDGGFTFLIDNETPYVARGTSVDLLASIDRRGGHVAGIDFTLASPPTGVTLASAEDVTADAQILTIQTDGTASLGSAALTLSATDGTLTRTYELTLTIAAAVTITGTDDGLRVDGGTRHQFRAVLSATGNYRSVFSFEASAGTILPSARGDTCFWEAPAADPAEDVEVTITATLTDNPDLTGEVTLIVPRSYVGSRGLGQGEWRRLKAAGLSRWG